MRSELDIFAEMTLKRGGVWYKLCEKYGLAIYKRKTNTRNIITHGTQHPYIRYLQQTVKEYLQVQALQKQWRNSTT